MHFAQFSKLKNCELQGSVENFLDILGTIHEWIGPGRRVDLYDEKEIRCISLTNDFVQLAKKNF